MGVNDGSYCAQPGELRWLLIKIFTIKSVRHSPLQSDCLSFSESAPAARQRNRFEFDGWTEAP